MGSGRFRRTFWSASVSNALRSQLAARGPAPSNDLRILGKAETSAAARLCMARWASRCPSPPLSTALTTASDFSTLSAEADLGAAGTRAVQPPAINETPNRIGTIRQTDCRMLLLAGTPALTRAHRAGENGPFRDIFSAAKCQQTWG